MTIGRCLLVPFVDKGDIIGHEPIGIVEEVGSAVTHIKPGDRVVNPLNVSCGHCFMCRRGLQSQCEAIQVREYDNGAFWVDDPSDLLGVLDLKTHTAPLDEAPEMYEKFQKKEDVCIKVVLEP